MNFRESTGKALGQQSHNVDTTTRHLPTTTTTTFVYNDYITSVSNADPDVQALSGIDLTTFSQKYFCRTSDITPTRSDTNYYSHFPHVQQDLRLYGRWRAAFD